jgi:hypothetical protein
MASTALETRCILLASFGHRLVVKTNDKFTQPLQLAKFLFILVAINIRRVWVCGQSEQSAFLVVVLAVVFGGISRNQTELDRATIIQLESIVGEVLAALGVILIFVCPMQDHFLPGIGDGIGIALVAPLADEVALVVVAGKEGQ